MSDADVYKSGHLAARLRRTPRGVEFRYLDEYLERGGEPIASTLAPTPEPRITPAGAVPPFFAGLLPEGRRLTSLRRNLKASADDELTLLLAVGSDPIGDVQIVPEGTIPDDGRAAVSVERSFSEIRFSRILGDAGIVDPAGIAGVQDKASARMLSLPLRRAHERYILKLSPPEYPYVVENEALFLDVARRAGLNVASASVVEDADERTGLLVVRFDRVSSVDGVRRLAVEDACQLLDRWPADKYNVTMEDVALAIARRCAAPAIATRDVFRQIVFAWLTGNGDLHAKNISVLQRENGDRVVAPAYDLPSTVLYGDLTFALRVQGRVDGFSRRILRDFARDIGLPDAAAIAVLDQLVERTGRFIDEIERLPFDTKTIAETRRRLADRRRLASAG